MSSNTVFCDGWARGMRRRLIDEGDLLTSHPSEAQLVLGLDPQDEEQIKQLSLLKGKVTVWGGITLPKTACQAMGFNGNVELRSSVTLDIPQFYATCWYDKGFSNQISVCLPFSGLGDKGLGARGTVGSATRFVDSEHLRGQFQNKELLNVLEKWGYCGFLSLNFIEGLIVGIETACPAYSFYNQLEYITGKLSDWFLSPKEERKKLYEAWAFSALISRWPFPLEGQKFEKEEIFGLTPQLEKHFWLFDNSLCRRALYSNEGEVGVATAWAEGGGFINNAWQRVLDTMRRVVVEGKQMRWDLGEVAKRDWGRLKESQLL